MAKISNYEQNKITENSVVDFLLKFCYPKLFDKAERIQDTECQLKGVDIIACKDNKEESHNVKSQCSARYVNHPVSSFAHEILASNKKEERLGWNIKKNDANTYVYCWVYKSDTNETKQIISSDSIYDVEVMFVDKSSLEKYLNDIGATNEALLERARYMMRVPIYRTLPISDTADTDEMYLSFSDDLREKSIKLIIKKRLLKRAAYKHVRVTQNSIIDIDNIII